MPLNFRLFGAGKDGAPEVVEEVTTEAPAKKPSRRRSSRRSGLGGKIRRRSSNQKDEGGTVSKQPAKKAATSTESNTTGVVGRKKKWGNLIGSAVAKQAKESGTGVDFGAAFASFVPRTLQMQITAEVEDSGLNPTFDGAGHQMNAAMLFADASGFTALTEKLAKQSGSSAAGAENMCRIINVFFGKLIDVIHAYGGDIMKFEGDAMTVTFAVMPADGPEAVFNTGGKKEGFDASTFTAKRLKKAASMIHQIMTTYSPDMKTAVLRATQCSIDLHETVRRYTEEDKDASGLSLHTCVGCGPLTSVHLGGVLGRYEYVIAGTPMDQIAEAENYSKSDMTVVSPEATALISDVIEVGIVVGAASTPKAIAATAAAAAAAGAAAEPKWKGFIDVQKLATVTPRPDTIVDVPVTPAIAGLLQRYIPGAVSQKLMTGHTGLIAELREVSVLFINTEGVDLTAEANGGVDGATTRGQNLMLEIQKNVFLHEGSINKMTVGDKGLITIVVFGLPPLPHEDDPRRAVRAAMSMAEGIPERLGKDVRCTIGVSSGQTFCGVVGSERRREYTVMGDMVNLAARLMQKASELGKKVVVDENTFKFTQDNFSYDALEPVSLKGKAKRAKIFVPTEDKEDEGEKENLGIMGRQVEKNVVQNMIASLCTYHRGGTLLITGDHGSGRPQLVQEMASIVEEAGLLLIRRPRKNNNDKDVSREVSAKGKPGEKRPSALFSTIQQSKLLSIGVFKAQSTPSLGNELSETALEAKAPRLTVYAGAESNVAALKSQAEKLSEQIVEGVDEYAAWAPILAAMVEHLIGFHKFSAGDEMKLSEVLVGMLDDAYKIFKSELNTMIHKLQNTIQADEKYVEREETPREKAKKLKRRGDMILQLCKRFCEDHESMIVLHLKVGTTQISRKKDAYSWDLAQRFARWLRGADGEGHAGQRVARVEAPLEHHSGHHHLAARASGQHGTRRPRPARADGRVGDCDAAQAVQPGGTGRVSDQRAAAAVQLREAARGHHRQHPADDAVRLRLCVGGSQVH